MLSIESIVRSSMASKPVSTLCAIFAVRLRCALRRCTAPPSRERWTRQPSASTSDRPGVHECIYVCEETEVWLRPTDGREPGAGSCIQLGVWAHPVAAAWCPTNLLRWPALSTP
jgi:hypothetical protein